MNHTQYLTLGDKAPVNVIQLQVLACDVPTQTEKQAKAGLHSQFVHCVELEEGGPVTLRFIKGDMHFNDDMVGRKLIFSVGPEGNNFNKMIPASGNPYIQVNTGARIQPVPETTASLTVSPPPAAAPAPAPVAAAPTPTPAAAAAPSVQVSHVSPDPEPESEPETAGEIELHPSLIKFARGQALCRMAAARVFRECGFEVSPDQLGGVATSLFIQLSQKGVLDDVIACGFPAKAPAKPAAKPAPAPRPVAEKPAPQVTPAPAAPQPAVKPPVAATPTPGKSPATPAAPIPTEPAAAPVPDPVVEEPAAPAKSQTKEEVLKKYDTAMRKGDMKDALMTRFQTTRESMGIPWDEISPFVVACAVEKYGQAVTEAYLTKMRGVKGMDEEGLHRVISTSPAKFLDLVEKTAKAAK